MLLFKKISCKNGKIEIGFCDNFNIDINIMVRETLKMLIGKEDILIDMKKKYYLECYLERVFCIENIDEEVHPILILDYDVISFLYKSGIIDDLDYYIVSCK